MNSTLLGACTGANNLMKSTDYSLMVGFATSEETVAGFDYALITQAPYVAAIGSLRFVTDRQWDWVQLFRVDRDGRLAETWLAGMGGTDIFGFPQPWTAWEGHELPTSGPRDSAGSVVEDYLRQVWVAGYLDAGADVLADQLVIHDWEGADWHLSLEEHQSDVRRARERGPITLKQLFAIDEGDLACAAHSWVFDNGHQWDAVQAFRLEGGRIAEMWLPVVGGTDDTLDPGPGSRWSPQVDPRAGPPSGAARASHTQD